MTYSSSNPAVATISSSTATLKAVGTSDITARQAGNTTYAPAKYIRPLNVSKGDQTITFGPIPDKVVEILILIYSNSKFGITCKLHKQ